MSYKNIILFCVIFSYLCDADILKNIEDLPEKCSITDGECQKNTISTLMRGCAKTGIPELGIPPLDPYDVENTTVSILNMLFITMTKGLVEGATNCEFTKFETNIDKKYTYTESFCDNIKISGRYNVEVGPLAQSLVGKPVSGDGFGGIEIEKLVLKMKIPFSVQKLKDGETYLVPKSHEAEYSTDVKEMIRFQADDIWLGGREISAELINYMNKNWPMILRSFGRLFSDRVMATFYGYMDDFFLTIPASKLVSDDLSPYVTN